MMNKILRLANEFISIKSVSGNPKEMEEILELALTYLKEFGIERFSKNGIKSALVYNMARRPKKFKVVLNGHLDVIPGKDSQYRPQIRGDKLYGVGSMDMKANAACLIMAFKETAKKVDYPLALQLVTDEQTGSLSGTKYQVEKGVRANFVIAGETTNFHPVNRAKGVLWLKISAVGKTAHSAYPWLGENPIWKMNEFLNLLKEKYPIPTGEVWETTLNVSNIETSNKAFNKIPGGCVVWLDVRYVPEERKTILRDIKNLVPKEWELSVVFEEPALEVDENNRYLKALREAAIEVLKHEVLPSSAHGTSDATYYALVGCPGVEFGPIGVKGNMSDEWVDIPSLKLYYQILIKFLMSLKHSPEEV